MWHTQTDTPIERHKLKQTASDLRTSYSMTDEAWCEIVLWFHFFCLRLSLTHLSPQSSPSLSLLFVNTLSDVVHRFVPVQQTYTKMCVWVQNVCYQQPRKWNKYKRLVECGDFWLTVRLSHTHTAHHWVLSVLHSLTFSIQPVCL